MKIEIIKSILIIALIISLIYKIPNMIFNAINYETIFLMTNQGFSLPSFQAMLNGYVPYRDFAFFYMPLFPLTGAPYHYFRSIYTGMALEIVIPGEYMGDVLGDLNGRRGKVKEMIARGATQIIRAGVPLAELFGYATVIRSLTSGHASYTQEPEGFEIVPESVKEQLLNK